MSTKAVPAIIFAFVVGGLVGYVLSSGLALTAPAALADAVPIPDAPQGEITSPTPIQPRPPSQDIAKDAGIPASPTATPTQTHSTEPPVTLATGSSEATKTPTAPLIESSPMRKPRKHDVTRDPYAQDAHAQDANKHQSDTNKRRRRGDTVNLKAHAGPGTTAVARLSISGSAYSAPARAVAEQPNIPLPLPLPIPTLPLPIPLPVPTFPTTPVPTIPVLTSTMTAPVFPPHSDDCSRLPTR
jgi:hypothetical protein